MTATFEAIGASNANLNSCAPTPPAGSGTGFLALIFWGNPTDTPLGYNSSVWRFLGDAEGGAGAWGPDTGTRHISAFWTDQAISTAQTFTNGGGDSATSLTIGYILRFTKTLTYWSVPEVAEAADNVGGAAFAATFNRDPGFTDGDTAVSAFVANTDAVNPAGITVTLPGTTQGTGTTAVVTSPFGTGNDARVVIRRTTIAGTSNGTYPSAGSTTDFTGTVLLTRVRDTDTQPTPAPVAQAGGDAAVEPWVPYVLDGSASTYTGTPTVLWEHLSGGSGMVEIANPTSLSTSMSVSPSVWADEDYVFRLTVTDAGGTDTDDVTLTVLRSSEMIRHGGVDRPLRVTLPQQDPGVVLWDGSVNNLANGTTLSASSSTQFLDSGSWPAWSSLVAQESDLGTTYGSVAVDTTRTRNGRNSRSLKFTTPAGARRVQLASRGPAGRWTPDAVGSLDLYYGFSLYYGTDWGDASTLAAEISESSWHDPIAWRTAGPNGSLNFSGDDMSDEGGATHSMVLRRNTVLNNSGFYTDGAGLDKINAGQIVTGQWMDFVVRVRWSSSSTNAVRTVWRDGVLVGSKTTLNAADNLEHLLRVGMYHVAIGHARTMWVDNIRIGTSFAAVDPAVG